MDEKDVKKIAEGLMKKFENLYCEAVAEGVRDSFMVRVDEKVRDYWKPKTEPDGPESTRGRIPHPTYNGFFVPEYFGNLRNRAVIPRIKPSFGQPYQFVGYAWGEVVCSDADNNLFSCQVDGTPPTYCTQEQLDEKEVLQNLSPGCAIVFNAPKEKHGLPIVNKQE